MFFSLFVRICPCQSHALWLFWAMSDVVGFSLLFTGRRAGWRPYQWRGMELGSGGFLQFLMWNQTRWSVLSLPNLSPLLWHIVFSQTHACSFSFRLSTSGRKMTWEGTCVHFFSHILPGSVWNTLNYFFPDRCRTKPLYFFLISKS